MDETAYKRLEILQLAAITGNVSEVCRKAGISRTTFYKYKQQYEQFGLEGLRDKPRFGQSHPNKTPTDVVFKIVALSLANPARGCNWLSQQLGVDGIKVSHPTVQKILNKNNLGKKHDRWRRLEQLSAQPGFVLSDVQRNFLRKHNPAWRDRGVLLASSVGEVVSQTAVSVGRRALGSITLHVALDQYSGFGFAHLTESERSMDAAQFLEETLLPFFSEQDAPIQTILTPRRAIFSGDFGHPYRFIIELAKIQQRFAPAYQQYPTGYLKRFASLILKELDPLTNSESLRLSVLQAQLSRAVARYNYEDGQVGYPLMGKRPFDQL